MTDTLVPDTTPVSPNSLRMVIAAVVRLKEKHLHHEVGTRAVVCSTRDGRYNLELIVPGSPIKFWVASEAVDVLQAPEQDWWKLLTSTDDEEPSV